eukprot:CAMPEP_0177728872 /NCGR_PEP_ID=MMETSP0484_2-20121128/21119_1 /TAXON_ID=354590 /ORGANISM="Rhodomonas lens, Strain RHODO" /LENGTH=223 /DNA_ID=CAMNT_0019241687 /DNA_START=159 /DNA_END=829 /DNA_ORIENTATION=+
MAMHGIQESQESAATLANPRSVKSRDRRNFRVRSTWSVEGGVAAEGPASEASAAAESHKREREQQRYRKEKVDGLGDGVVEGAAERRRPEEIRAPVVVAKSQNDAEGRDSEREDRVEDCVEEAEGPVSAALLRAQGHAVQDQRRRRARRQTSRLDEETSHEGVALDHARLLAREKPEDGERAVGGESEGGGELDEEEEEDAIEGEGAELRGGEQDDDRRDERS